MKKRSTISGLLGITQDDMAMLLKINRSQWSMYESGKRDLPLTAKLQLAEMLKFVKSHEATTAKSLSQLTHQEIKKQLQLEKLLRENEYQQLWTIKKIAILEKNYTTNVTTLQLTNFLINQPYHKTTFDNELLQKIAAKASKAITKNGLITLTKYQIKQELFQLEKMLLAASLKKMLKNSEI